MKKTAEKNGIKKRHGLIAVICTAIILITLAVTISVSLVNYQQYREAISEIYTDNALATARMIEGSMPQTEWKKVKRQVERWREDLIDDDTLLAEAETGAFSSAMTQIQQITDSMQLTNVTIFTLDQEWMQEITEADFALEETGFMTFIMDFYPSDRDEVTYEIGDIDIWWDDYAGCNDYRELFTEIIESGKPTVLEEILPDGTMLYTYYYPIFVQDEFTAMVMISQPAQEIEDFISVFFRQSLGIGLGITAVLIVLAIVFFALRVVRPLRLITMETVQFVSDNAAVSDQLSKVRTRDEIQQLAESVLQMETDVQHYIEKIEKVTAEEEHIRTELNVAARIQEDMLPRVFPPYPDREEFSIYASMDPAKEVGGDFYDFFFVDPDHLALVMADVAGKGVPASLFMVIAKTLIKTRAQQGGSPAEILQDVNAQLCDGNEENMFVTVWLAIVDLRTGKGVAANAGHEHPVRRDTGDIYRLVEYRHSPAVALMDSIRFREHEFELKPGDRLFVYTDGLPEATNARDELYGTERLLTVLNAHPDTPTEGVLPLVTQDVARFVGEAPQFDDLTMLVFEYRGKKGKE